MDPEFVADEPAVLIGNTLIVSDLHIGIEHDYFLAGIKINSQTNTMRDRLDNIIKMTKAKNLILLGDIKHKVPGVSYQEIKEIPEFLNHLAKKIKITYVIGNHDPGVEKLVPKSVDIKPTHGFLKNKIYYNHGHAWPDKSFLGADYLIMGHMQPQIQFKNNLGATWMEAVWVRTELNKKTITEKYGKYDKLPEAIIVPSFNKMAGGHALNVKKEKQRKTPMMSMIKKNTSKIYLLDGTFLGELKDL
ncbi:MAG: metallophosphoesterase [Candidatus Aenigmatarchaeota archaeon]